MLNDICMFMHTFAIIQSRVRTLGQGESLIVIILTQGVAYDHLKFFEERETYWAPATTESGLYTQLYENKYRELPRNEIR